MERRPPTRTVHTEQNMCSTSRAVSLLQHARDVQLYIHPTTRLDWRIRGGGGREGEGERESVHVAHRESRERWTWLANRDGVYRVVADSCDCSSP